MFAPTIKSEDGTLTSYAKISKVDEEQRLVYAEVYSPYTLDTYSDMMLAEDIVEMAHSFLQKTELHKRIDTNHDYVSNGSYPVESFIARRGDPDFTEGSWVLGVKVVEDDVWEDVKSGKLSGFSMAGFAKMVPAVAEVWIDATSIGRTEVNDNHDHLFFVELDDNGRVVGGRTSMDKNHTHEIKYGTATEMTYGHSHRYFI